MESYTDEEFTDTAEGWAQGFGLARDKPYLQAFAQRFLELATPDRAKEIACAVEADRARSLGWSVLRRAMKDLERGGADGYMDGK